MKYRLTILNIASVALILIDSYIYISSYLRGEIYEYGFVALALTFIIGFTGLFIDFFLQKTFRNYWIINGIEVIVLIIFSIFYLYTSREKPVVLPEDFSAAFSFKNKLPLFTEIN